MPIDKAAGTEAHLAGKLVIPDLTAIHESQQQNLRAMTAITAEVTSSFADLTKSQTVFLNDLLGEYERSLKENVNVQDLSGNLKSLQDKLAKSAALTKNLEDVSNTVLAVSQKSSEQVIQAVEQSMAKIDLTATKFSGG